MNSQILHCQVFHHRFFPKVHRLKTKFFWYYLDLDQVDQVVQQSKFISHNRFNLFSFYDSDHIRLSGISAKQNFQILLESHNITEKIQKAMLLTHLRVLGYVFNPVSFVLITLESGQQCAIIEVANTFNEIKPYFVPPNCFTGPDQFEFTTDKLFYVSPFMDFDTKLVFKFQITDGNLSIVVDDYKGGEKILTAGVSGKFKKLLASEVRYLAWRFPLITWKIIAMIHGHALILWFKRIQYKKKSDQPDLQKGMMRWKD